MALASSEGDLRVRRQVSAVQTLEHFGVEGSMFFFWSWSTERPSAGPSGLSYFLIWSFLQQRWSSKRNISPEICPSCKKCSWGWSFLSCSWDFCLGPHVNSLFWSFHFVSCLLPIQSSTDFLSGPVTCRVLQREYCGDKKCAVRLDGITISIPGAGRGGPVQACALRWETVVKPASHAEGWGMPRDGVTKPSPAG